MSKNPAVKLEKITLSIVVFMSQEVKDNDQVRDRLANAINELEEAQTLLINAEQKPQAVQS